MPRSKGGAEIKKIDIAVEGERASFDGNRSQKNYSTWVYILYAREYNAPGTCAFIERPFPRRVIFVCASVSAGFQSSIRIVIGSFPRRCAHLLTEVFSFSPVNFGVTFFPPNPSLFFLKIFVRKERKSFIYEEISS